MQNCRASVAIGGSGFLSEYGEGVGVEVDPGPMRGLKVTPEGVEFGPGDFYLKLVEGELRGVSTVGTSSRTVVLSPARDARK